MNINTETFLAMIQTEKPDWTAEECYDFYLKHEDKITEAMLERGYECLEELIC